VRLFAPALLGLLMRPMRGRAYTGMHTYFELGVNARAEPVQPAVSALAPGEGGGRRSMARRSRQGTTRVPRRC
jgi:hypothetical protein